MCGISGVFLFDTPVPAFRTKLTSFLYQAMYVGSLRGRDSTGIMTVNREDSSVCTIKRAVDGATFGDLHNVDKALVDVDECSAFVIHNRKATMGATNDRGAHPFSVGPITLVHNGTLWQHRTLGGGNNCVIDSEAIAHALCKQEKTEVLESLDGAFVLVWHDARDNTLNIARNKKRPLGVGFVKGENCLVFCSEDNMLTWLTDRNDLDVKTVFSPKVNFLYTWDLNDESPSVKNYVTESFTPTNDYEDWDEYNGHWQGNRFRQSNGATYTPPANVPAASHIPPTQVEAQVARKLREAVLEKFSMKVGDRIPFICYDVETSNYAKDSLNVMGYDEGGKFEVVSYQTCKGKPTSEIKNSLCMGSILTVKDTPGWKDWPIVMVVDVEVTTPNFFEGSDEETLNAHLEKITSNATAAISPDASGEDEDEEDRSSLRPSAFCTGGDGEGACTSVCSGCAYMEREETDSGAASIDNVSNVVVGPGRFLITEEEWNQLTKEGCSNCSCNLIDPEDTFWTYEESPLCGDCMEDLTTPQGAAIH